MARATVHPAPVRLARRFRGEELYDAGNVAAQDRLECCVKLSQPRSGGIGQCPACRVRARLASGVDRKSDATAGRSKMSGESRLAPELLSCGFAMASDGSGTGSPVRSVTIVSGNPETLDALQQYLRAAGLGARGTSQLDAEVGANSSAVVFFADDYRYDDAIRALDQLRRKRPRVLAIVVTAVPGRFGQPKGTMVTAILEMPPAEGLRPSAPTAARLPASRE